MGARLGRVFRNFNLENRVLREISKDKPSAAPRHAAGDAPLPASPEVSESVKQKNESLAALLQSVYVESSDPPGAPAEEVTVRSAAERRPIRVSLPASVLGLTEVTDVPEGKLTLSEALKALAGHHQQPGTWTPEKLAQEYSLDLKDTKAVLEFFIPFKVEIIPAKTRTAKQIKDS